MQKTLFASSVVAAFAAGALGYKYYKYSQVPEWVEEDVADAIDAVDNDDDEEERSPRFRPKRFRREKLITKVVRKIKMRFQVIEKPEAADRAAVQRYAYDVLDEMVDISDADKVRVAPLAAALYWVKTDTEIVANTIRYTAESRYREHEYARWRHGGIWGLLYGRNPAVCPR